MVTAVWVEVRRKNRKADIPPVTVTDDGCGQHLGPSCHGLLCRTGADLLDGPKQPPKGAGVMPEFAPASAARARPRSTAASSKTCAETSCRQASPVTCLVIVPSAATVKMRPASSLRFQALNVLIKSKPEHGTFTDELDSLSARASTKRRRH